MNTDTEAGNWQGRCMAVTGTASTGPRYCGYPAKTEVADRPVCGVHKKGQPGIEWSDRLGYPHGPYGRWDFSKGVAR